MITDNITVIGNEHVRRNIECQDNSVSWEGSGYTAVIVCDGHGGEKYIRSKTGSEIACRVGKEAIEGFMEGLRRPFTAPEEHGIFSLDRSDFEKQLSQLEKTVILRWNEEVRAHLAEFPFDGDYRFENLRDEDKESLLRVGEKAYGSTFIAAVLAKDFCFALKLGDGNVVMLSEGEIFIPEEFPFDFWSFDGTFSLCDSDAHAVFSHAFYESTDTKRIDGALVMTDGIIKCYHTIDGYFKFVANVFNGYREDGFDVAHSDLSEALETFTQKGSGDDMSVGVVLRSSAIPAEFRKDFSEDSDVEEGSFEDIVPTEFSEDSEICEDEEFCEESEPCENAGVCKDETKDAEDE